MTFTVFRHAAYDSPWWAIPSSRSGRFNRARQATTQYLCLHPLGPAAEMLRHNVGPTGDPNDVVLNLWTATVAADAVVHIDFGDAAGHGCTPDELVGDDYGPTQSLAERVRAGGARGMVVPSAALPGTHNLVLFGERVLHPYLWQPLAPEEIPTGHLTDGARATAELAAQVRWFGSTHSALERWKVTGDYEPFADPMPTRW
ncbi:RES family NAD+ phosphorylase [Mycobacterium sp. NPDC003449]